MEPKQVKTLLVRIAQGDEEAFGLLFNFYYPKLIQLALAFVPGIVAAQEVVSDLFYKILKNPKTLEHVKEFDNYIFLAVKNQSFTYLKKNKHRAILDSIHQKEDYILPDYKNPENSLLSDELFRLVSKVVNDLPPKRKAIFQLVKEEGKKYKEVAEILGISIKTVELQMSLALKLLRKSVKEYQESKDIKIRKLGRTDFLGVFFSFL
ncbi:MAG: RNA polymerase sigma-70 factor [Cyclobacteriaceae bacterium]|nr:RNA polymerase sigma-70 factor [Cyclobacteriaceae bacterium]